MRSAPKCLDKSLLKFWAKSQEQISNVPWLHLQIITVLGTGAAAGSSADVHCRARSTYNGEGERIQERTGQERVDADEHDDADGVIISANGAHFMLGPHAMYSVLSFHCTRAHAFCVSMSLSRAMSALANQVRVKGPRAYCCASMLATHRIQIVRGIWVVNMRVLIIRRVRLAAAHATRPDYSRPRFVYVYLSQLFDARHTGSVKDAQAELV